MNDARPIRDTVETVIFGTETRGGNLFDIALLVTILASVAVVDFISDTSHHVPTACSNLVYRHRQLKWMSQCK